MKLARWILRLTMGRRHPVVRGTISVPGLDEDAVVVRDRWGIPHIHASCDHDAWFALGFCHGQDRAFQLEGLIRTARGTLSELFGADFTGADLRGAKLGGANAGYLTPGESAADFTDIKTDGNTVLPKDVGSEI